MSVEVSCCASRWSVAVVGWSTVRTALFASRGPTGGAPEQPTVPAALPCEDIAGIGPSSKSPPSAEEYVCIEKGEAECPSPSAAHAKFAVCVDTSLGEACAKRADGSFVSGECVRRETRSACGPDPAAVGACCYYVKGVVSTIYS